MITLNGWYRLWILASLILGALITLSAGTLWMNTLNAEPGPIARSAATFWLIASIALLVMGHAIAWIVRGFRPRLSDKPDP